MGAKKPRTPASGKKTNEDGKSEIELQIEEQTRALEELKKKLSDRPSDEDEIDPLISGKTEKRACKLCPEMVSKQNLARHIKTVHKKLKPFDCSKCEQRFTTKNNKENHELKCTKKKNHEEKSSTGITPLKTPTLKLRDINNLLIGSQKIDSSDDKSKPPHQASATYVPDRPRGYRDDYIDHRGYRRNDRPDDHHGSRSRSRSRSRQYPRRSYYDHPDYTDYYRHRDRHSRSSTRSRSPLTYSLPASTAALKKPEEMDVNISDWKKAVAMANKVTTDMMQLSQFLVTLGKNLSKPQ